MLTRSRQSYFCLPGRVARLFLVLGLDTISGNFITQILDYNDTRTPFTYEFAEELLREAGFCQRATGRVSSDVQLLPELVDLDSWEGNSRNWKASMLKPSNKTARRSNMEARRFSGKHPGKQAHFGHSGLPQDRRAAA